LGHITFSDRKKTQEKTGIFQVFMGFFAKYGGRSRLAGQFKAMPRALN